MKVVRITDNKDIGDFKPRFKIGDKVRVNEFGRKEMKFRDHTGTMIFDSGGRGGVIIEIVIVDYPIAEGITSNTYYVTDGARGGYGVWEEYIELDSD